MRLIVDTDTAGDDVTALLMALRRPGVVVEAITVVAGNVDFDQQVENALYTVQMAGRGGEVPVYPGCRKPLLRPPHPVPEIQGEDGMGNAFFPQAVQRPEPRHAVAFLIEAITAAPGEITLVTLGPLTNLAVALTQAPHIASLVRDLYVMGGAIWGQGNVTPAAEYNVWADPEAARIVFRAGLPLTLVSWEVALRHGYLDPEGEATIRACDTPLAHFFLQVNRRARTFDRERWGVPASLHPDALTMAIALEPALITEARHCYVDVETVGELTRGMTVVDHAGLLDRPANVRVVYAADRSRFQERLLATLCGM